MRRIANTILLILFSFSSTLFPQKNITFDKESFLFIEISQDNNGDYVSIFKADSLDIHFWGGIAKFDEGFNYETYVYKKDSFDIQLRDFVITENNDYLIAGSMGIDNGEGYQTPTLCFILVDQNLNLLSESFIEMPENYTHPNIRTYRTPQGRNYVMVHQENSSAIFQVFVELSDEGSILKYKFYTEGGMHVSPFPNPNSDTSFYIYQDAASGMYHSEIVELDTNLNYTKTPIYCVFNGESYDFGPRGTCKWLNDTTYILATEGTEDNGRQLFLYKMGTDHQFYEEAVEMGLDNVQDNAIRRRGMDWKNPDSIYVASWYWPSMSITVPYYVAVIDQDFQILGSKSVGGGEYNILVNSLIATEDGGCILVGGQRNITIGDEYDWDAYLAYYSASDLITAAPETPNPYDSDYLLFPNPGKELSVQTTRKEVIIEIYNQSGIRVLNTKLTDDFQSKVNTSKLKKGVYVCQFIDKYGFREIKKWIKL